MPHPTLVLTRPEAQSRAIAAALGGDARVVISPVMRIVAGDEAPDLSCYRGVILTSANAVRFVPDLSGMRIYCVGERTAEAAMRAGGEIALVAQDADTLIAQNPGPGPLIHLHGEHTRGDVAKRLNLAGIETDEVMVYRQEALPLSDEAKALIEGDTPVVLPLYSPRSARLVASGVTRIGAQVQAIAMSLVAADTWRQETGSDAEFLTTPSGKEMLTRIVAKLRGFAGL